MDITNDLILMLQTLRTFSVDDNGVTRLPFTKEADDAVSYLEQKMQEVGLETYVDVSGAVHGIKRGILDKRIVIGSHYDSVKHGGAFDGIAGVVCGIEIAKLLKDKDLFYTLEIIGFNDEEGVRFDTGFFSSKAFLGEWDIEELKTYYDDEGINTYEAMEQKGLVPEKLKDIVWDLDKIRCFLEIHIEQGPILESEKKDLGIVNGIVGMKRFLLIIDGRADHAGTTPMNMRYDALVAASEIIQKVEAVGNSYENAVATVGFCKIEPNTVNTVPEKVEISLDMRTLNLDDLNSMEKEILQNIKEVTDKRNLTYFIEPTLDAKPAHMDEKIQEYLEQEIDKLGYSFIKMSSGAGHDSLPISRKVPTAMLFVPSKNGRSHCKEEWTEPQDLTKAVKVLLNTIDVIDKER